MDRLCLSFFIDRHHFYLKYKRRFSTIGDNHLINEKIRGKEFRVITADGEQLGILSSKEAMAAANERNLDLVLIAPKAKPPVCKIIDYGKFRYEQTKKDKEAKKKQAVVSIKEVRMSPNIEQHDIDTKLRGAKKFLAKGDKIKVSVRFRGREMAHTASGREILLNIAEQLSDVADMEKPPRMEGRSMVMFLAPKKDK